MFDYICYLLFKLLLINVFISFYMFFLMHYAKNRMAFVFKMCRVTHPHHFLLVLLYHRLALWVNRCSRMLKLLDICYSCDDFFWFPSFSSSSSLYSPPQWNTYLSLWEMSFLRAANQLPDGRLASHVNCRGNWVRRRSLIELIRGREWKQMERICGGGRVAAGLHSIVGLH